MTDLKIFGEHDERTVAQMWRCMGVGSVAGGVLCADGHLGYAQPVGGVVAYEEHVSICGVGFDIGCGNMAVRARTLKYERHRERVPVDRSTTSPSEVSFGLGPPQRRDRSITRCSTARSGSDAGVAHLKQMARNQLGTVGSGNHYVDLFEDEEGLRLDRRAFRLARPRSQERRPTISSWPAARTASMSRRRWCVRTSEIGARYLAAMTLAGEYAYAGREWVTERVRRILGAKVLDTVHNHHNYAWRERHGERDLWVVRKGATPAFPGQRGFVGGSMGDDAVILSGVESDAAAASLYSTVHGAGRVMSRTEAKGKRNRKTGEVLTQGRVSHDEMQTWLRGRGVHLVGGDLDEAPQAYRRLPDVLAHHDGTVRIEHTLRPFMVVMAGADVFDPFKD